MRSRFSAYALGLVDYVLASTHPDGPHHGRYGQREEVASFCERTQFEALRVLESDVEGDQGHVAFFATLSQSGTDCSFGELSTFYLVDGRWLYHSGAPFDPPADRLG
jgi:SEC-C motif-containing protein